MTAEIAILNRSAIALAADSAVTISVGGKTKVYDTAEKLFELSKKQPIAIMIYNNVEFVGVPLDVLIRKFRNEQDGRNISYSTMQDACSAFIDYMGSFDHDVTEEKRYLSMILREEFKKINTALRDAVFDSINKWIENDGKEARIPPIDFLKTMLTDAIKLEESRPLPGFLEKVNITKFRSRYGDTVKRAVTASFDSVDIDVAAHRQLEKLALALVRSARGSDLRTGLVFGGFAEKDMFPTLRFVEIDGVYFDEIKILSSNEIDIDRMKVRAAVVPFAQKEMVERFMFGLDSELEKEIGSFVKNVVNEVVEVAAKDIDAKVTSGLKKKVSDRFNTLLKDLKDSSRQDLLDIVYFMSKKELADIAHALVELTSQKRRFSTDEQTVGGPIDVAILTKNEGFVWIQRKHYFNSDVNGGYAARIRAN